MPQEMISRYPILGEIPLDRRFAVDYAEAAGREHLKRALVIAPAGGHNLLMLCPK